MSVCLFAGTKAVVVAAGVFTLSWTHSVEKVRWEEDWRLTPAGLTLIEGRVKGSGAGMEPPEGAKLVDGWWHYRPSLPPLDRLTLAASGATVSGWRICADGRCVDLEPLAAGADGPLRLAACKGE